MPQLFKRTYSTDWVESSVENAQSSEGYIGSSITSKKIAATASVLGAIFAVYLARIIWLQLGEGNAYRVLAENNRERSVAIASERGTVYDRQGIPLTKNVPKFSLTLLPQDLPRGKNERDAVIKQLSAITSRTEDDIRNIIEIYKSYRFESIVIADDIAYDEALKILILASDLPGISIAQGSKRLYLETPNAFAHLVGYMGAMDKEEWNAKRDSGYLPSDAIGKTGVEKFYELELRGTYGSRRVEVNAAGKEQSVLSEQPSTPGKHISLAIDSEMQEMLYEALKNGLKAYQKTRGAAVAMDPNTGEVLAIASVPSFNNNDFSGGIDRDVYAGYVNNPDHPLFFRAIGGVYPSGSSIKPAIAAAALAEHVITERTTVVSTGGIQVGNHFFPDWLAGGHGVTDVRKSLAWSINTFYYYIGGGYRQFEGLGIDRIAFYLRRFGFGEALGIDMPGEADGFVPNKEWKEEKKREPWYIGDTYNLSIGQGDLLVTPLQIAAMTAAIANNGTLYRPHVVRALLDPMSKKEEKIQPVAIRNTVTDAVSLDIVRRGMRDCVVAGSCHQLASLPFSSAAKTGTAQWNNTKPTHAWYTSFAPFEKPEIVLTVLVEEGGEGGIVAQPIAKEFYRWWGQNASGR